MGKLPTPMVIGRYAKYRLEFLQDEEPELYKKLLESGTLMAHLKEIEEKAQQAYEEDKQNGIAIIEEDSRWPTMQEEEKEARRRIVHEMAVEVACNSVVWV